MTKTLQEDQLTKPKTGNTKVKKRYIRQKTLQYKTFVKQIITEGLQAAFAEHPDKDLAKTKIDIEYPMDVKSFPQIVIKFYEQSVNNAGVGHEEWGPSPNDPNYKEGGPYTKFVKYYHRMYKGTLELRIVALSTVDRDKLADAVIEAIAMTDISPEGNAFYGKIYESLGEVPYAESHNIALNTDLIEPTEERDEIAPWMAEDVMVYQTSYRVPVWGDFYSLTPTSVEGESMIEEVDFYGWDADDPKDIPPEDFPNEEIPPEDYIKVKKHTSK